MRFPRFIAICLIAIQAIEQLRAPPLPARGAPSGMRSSGRVVEGARLESVYTVTPYRGFESLLLRHLVWVFRKICGQSS